MWLCAARYIYCGTSESKVLLLSAGRTEPELKFDTDPFARSQRSVWSFILSSTAHKTTVHNKDVSHVEKGVHTPTIMF